ncbi:MAG: translesion error-prone DNA polymerase V autoproteolytic subunit [Proteobacteria bacterium]|uniref:Translesion error-prone DNA polymerase V autoproteolytic subunit n=1 Tax=Candidatus Avisuccinivibrio stercorigallinarum TaxID=2840704 RepID=A0A9D9DAB8_9GAMM|nr:translesion error-prone DNA polymerase V autoproteolytic subunit [Candidatus Avisuccinivibrio stercorigallinarum]
MAELVSFGTAVDEKEHIELPLAGEKIEAGFPAPNGGYIDGSLDVNQFLISHPNSTFIYCVNGRSMVEAGIMPGDYVLVDTSLPAQDGSIVVACIDNEYTIKELHLKPKPYLLARNREYGPLQIDECSEVKIVGPVTGVVRRYRAS